MNADFLAVLDYWEKEKGISRDVLTAAVQEALLSAAKKAVGPARELRVAIEPKSGDIRAYAKLVVSDKVVSKHDQISVFDARRIKAEAQVGDEIEKEVTPTGFGRIAAQYAKGSVYLEAAAAGGKVGTEAPAGSVAAALITGAGLVVAGAWVAAPAVAQEASMIVERISPKNRGART